MGGSARVLRIRRLPPGLRRALLLCPSVGLVAIALLGASAADARRRSAVTCRSGKTVFHARGVRAFLVTHYGPSATNGGGLEGWLYVCRPGSRRAQEIYYANNSAIIGPHGFRRFGPRLGFVMFTLGVSNGSETDVGWLDLRTGELRDGIIDAGEDANPGDPLIPDPGASYVISPGGAVALIGGAPGEPQQVALLPVPRVAHPNRVFWAGGFTLGPARILLDAPNGGLDPASIAITPTSVTWRTTAGRPGSARR